MLAVSEKPDLILLDVMMPGMDGFEVCTKLQLEPGTQNIPVIFLTALNHEEDEIKGFELGAVDFIPKPIRAPIVQVRVKTHLSLKNSRDTFENLSMKDGLTGVFNRRHFNEHLDQEFKRAARNHTSLSLILADIDHFKDYNDNLGHTAGDDCLRRVAKALQDCLQRPADLLARYGGEEFACILPETPSEGAIKVANRWLENIVSLKIQHDFSRVSDYVSLSVGVATLKVGSADSPRDLIDLADKFLYKAKEGGRNQVQS
jgi:diguanylate cyclase (GGDEF)-like protein